MLDAVGELAEVIGSGQAILFTGAGFVAGVRDRSGRCLPSSDEVAADLWAMVFGSEPRDDSALSDLYDVALAADPVGVAAYLGCRFTVGDEPLPGHVLAWLAAPWRRIYTLNVDDVEVAAMRQTGSAIGLRSVSALRDGPGPRRGTVDVIHLNGMVGVDLERVTFSTLQYADRLCGRQLAYEQLIRDLSASPFVFVGTTLDEVVLWQHVMGHSSAADRTRAPRSFLVTRTLTRARARLLGDFRILWLPLDVESAAGAVFGDRPHRRR